MHRMKSTSIRRTESTRFLMRQAGSHRHSRKKTDDPALRELCAPHTEHVLLDDVITPGPETDLASRAPQSQQGLFPLSNNRVSRARTKTLGPSIFDRSMPEHLLRAFPHAAQALPYGSNGVIHLHFRTDARSRKQEGGSRKQEAGSRKQEAGSRKQEAGSRKQEA